MLAGVVDGVLVDPHAFFVSLVADRNPSNWRRHLEAIRPELERFGIGQQIDSSGEYRARLFLPHVDCRTAKPAPGEERWGVRQLEPCWRKMVDVVDGDGDAARWTWIDRGGPAYLPIGAPVDDGDGQPSGELAEAMLALIADTERIAGGVEKIGDTLTSLSALETTPIAVALAELTRELVRLNGHLDIIRAEGVRLRLR